MTMFASCRELLTVRDAARWIRAQTGVCPSIETIHRWMRKGVRGQTLRSHRIGGIWYITPGDLASFIYPSNGGERFTDVPEKPVRAQAGPCPMRQRQIKEAEAEMKRRLGRAL